MKAHFCTLFNSAYLARGIALLQSLKVSCSDFHLYVFAFDNATAEYLKALEEPHLTVVTLAELEDEDLLRIKPTRSAGEYCWTCTPATILYCINQFQLEHCTYIDADMWFYSDPRVLLREMGNNSVLISEHRYTVVYDQSSTSGKYCVQFMCFKNDQHGLNVLNWWRDRCLEWCYARHEDGKFGDQKYLDDWTTRFEGVHVMQHLGGGVAPWNVQQYKVVQHDQSIHLIHLASKTVHPIIFFHFHGLKFHRNNAVEMTGAGYALDSDAKRLLYRPYAHELLRIADSISIKSNITNPNGSSEELFPSHGMYGIKIFWRNYKAFINWIIGRNAGFRLLGNHIYQRSDLK